MPKPDITRGQSTRESGTLGAKEGSKSAKSTKSHLESQSAATHATHSAVKEGFKSAKSTKDQLLEVESQSKLSNPKHDFKSARSLLESNSETKNALRQSGRMPTKDSNFKSAAEFSVISESLSSSSGSSSSSSGSSSSYSSSSSDSGSGVLGSEGTEYHDLSSAGTRGTYATATMHGLGPSSQIAGGMSHRTTLMSPRDSITRFKKK